MGVAFAQMTLTFRGEGHACSIARAAQEFYLAYVDWNPLQSALCMYVCMYVCVCVLVCM